MGDGNNKVTNISSEELNTLIDLIKSVRYGNVSIIIQDNTIIQIEKSEKIRLK